MKSAEERRKEADKYHSRYSLAEDLIERKIDAVVKVGLYNTKIEVFPQDPLDDVEVRESIVISLRELDFDVGFYENDLYLSISWKDET